MFCPNCGAGLENGAQFCINCGTPVPKASEPEKPAGPALSMKWFKFLTVFGLWASSVVNILGGIINFFTRSLYMEAAILSKLSALAAIVIGVLAIYTRFRLAGFYKNGPEMLLRLNAASAVVNFTYMAWVFVFLNDSVAYYYSPLGNIASLIVSLVMLGAHNVYFQKREHLFTK